MPARPARASTVALLATLAALWGALLPATAAHAAERPVQGGRLDWGIKSSFQSYVTGPVAKGAFQLKNGAATVGGSLFRFHSATGSYDPDSGAFEASFSGGVGFQGHQKPDGAYELDLTVSRPTVKIDGGGGTLYADVTGKAKDTGEVSTRTRVPFATLGLGGINMKGGASPVVLTGVPVTLTDQGAKAFAGYYSAGDRLDPLSLSVDVKAAPAAGTPPSASAPGQTPQPPPDPQAARGAFADAAVDWGVRRTFREYVTGSVGQGRWTLAEGARDGGALFRFPQGKGAYDGSKGTLDASFAGTVHFTGVHLDLELGRPRVTVENGKGVLSADVTTGGETKGAVPLVEFDAKGLKTEGALATLIDAPATLTEGGSQAFGSMYKAGTEMDPVSLAVALDATAKLPALPDLGSTAPPAPPAAPGPSPAPVAEEGESSNAGPYVALGVAVLVLVGGATLLLLRRNRRTEPTPAGPDAPIAPPAPDAPTTPTAPTTSDAPGGSPGPGARSSPGPDTPVVPAPAPPVPSATPVAFQEACPMTSSHRRPLALAIAAAAVLGATAFVLPATAAGGGQAPAAVAAAPTPIVNGTLDWGVLASYRSYVLNIAKGTITPADGAALNSDGTFRFGSATGRYDKDGGHVVTAAFKGSVTFDAPAHGFKVTLANLRFDTGTKKLTADVTKNGTLTPGVPLADVAFGGPAMDKLGTTLTKEAAEQLGSDKYVGLAGDPLTAALEFAQPSPSPSPSATTSAPVSPSASAPSTGAAPSQSTGSPAADGPQQLVGGRLTWGVKDSFRSYVVKGGGSVTPAGGAVASGDTFAFALGKGELDTAKQKLSASFAGSLRFQRADHGVDMTFANLRVNAEGKKGTLVLDVKTPTATKADVPFATLDLSKTEYRTTGGLLTLNAVPAAFTAEGAAAIGAPSPDYAEGKPTDPVTLSVSVDKDAVLPTGTPTTAPTATPAPATAGGTGGAVGGGGAGGSIGGNLASTGAELPATALLAASGAAVVAGAGAVHLARRRRSVRM